MLLALEEFLLDLMKFIWFYLMTFSEKHRRFYTLTLYIKYTITFILTTITILSIDFIFTKSLLIL